MAGRRHAVRALLERGLEGTNGSGRHLLLLEGRPRHPDAPELEGTGEIKLESVDRAAGYFTTRSVGVDPFHAKTSGVYLRAEPGDKAALDGDDATGRAALIGRRLADWNSLANS